MDIFDGMATTQEDIKHVAPSFSGARPSMA